jgi:hypothetical protein
VAVQRREGGREEGETKKEIKNKESRATLFKIKYIFHYVYTTTLTFYSFFRHFSSIKCNTYKQKVLWEKEHFRFNYM